MFLSRVPLQQVRGLAASTVRHHRRTALCLLEFLGFDDRPAALRRLSPQRIDAFVLRSAAHHGRGSLQHVASQLPSFLRFLASQAFLAEIDCTTPIGRRDYCMCLLMATYGLRASEVAALLLDSILWRAGEIRPHRPKARKPLALPLTDEVGAALADYLQHGRPRARQRAVFLSSRRPIVPLRASGVRSAFRRRALHSKTGMPVTGSHCLRHSLALHLLRSDVSIEATGGLLDHRNLATTGQYLRLHDDDLRAAALDLPQPAAEVRP